MPHRASRACVSLMDDCSGDFGGRRGSGDVTLVKQYGLEAVVIATDGAGEQRSPDVGTVSLQALVATWIVPLEKGERVLDAHEESVGVVVEIQDRQREPVVRRMVGHP